MCGIFGGIGDSYATAEVVGRATKRLRHRGPDDEGYLLADVRSGAWWHCGGPDTDHRLALPNLAGAPQRAFDVAFGFRRLAILDLSPAGHQPMATTDARHWIIFNGEVYNYLELRNEMAATGQSFRSDSDTEVVLEAYLAWGPNCLRRFVGMWAFAILDLDAGKLFLARDPFGIKPLYYVQSADRLAFASEIKALLELPDVRPCADPARLYDYLRFGITDHAEETLFRGVRHLPPAHWMEVDVAAPGSARPVRYWSCDLASDDTISFDQAVDRVREAFLDSVRLHLRSDVPVGAALSGGIDSSSIVMAMRRAEPAVQIHTFSFVTDDPVLGEDRWIDLAARGAGAHVHKVRPSAEDVAHDIDTLVSAQDEPFVSTSIYAQSRVFELAHRAGIKVMLDGQGADELLAGYRSFFAARVASLLRNGSLLRAFRFVTGLGSFPGTSPLSTALESTAFLMPDALQRPLRAIVGRDYAPKWLDWRWFADHGVVAKRRRHRNGRDVLHAELLASFLEESLPRLLRYEDRNSMMHSIESRVPFLTADLVSFVFSLPESYIVADDGTTKAVFRSAMRGIVPDAILDRRDKIGFATPEREWLAELEPWVNGVIRSDAARRLVGVQVAAAEVEWRSFLAGPPNRPTWIWRWINAVRWVDRFQVTFE